MNVGALRRMAVALGCAALVACPARAEPPVALSGYNADISESSISGISSGAFMAVQFGTAWSSVIKGVGAVAGGPYWCAKANGMFGYWFAFARATGPCLSGPFPDLTDFFAKADAKSASGDIDSLQFLRRQKVYVFHGYNDKVVARPVTDAAAGFYRHYLGEANRGNLYYQTVIGAGHSLVVAQDPPLAGLNDCKASISPFIDQCGYDQAGIVLQHIYGALKRPKNGPLTGTIKSFDQSLYSKPDNPGSLSLGKTGYLFVPQPCEQGEACRVHIALHGCDQQADDEAGRRFIEHTGYNAWADNNHLIVLYPQTTAKWYPYNPQACWDLWGYVNYDDSYVTKSGPQIRTIKAMLDALTAGAAPAAVPAAAAAAPPDGLTVIDTSDNGADLAWVPLAGATAYRVFRAGADGQFAAVADVPGPSFADAGLSPRTAYRWRVSAIVNGIEGPASIDAAATTRPVPAPCANPGACPLGE
jgi:Esterase PHB depolymerase